MERIHPLHRRFVQTSTWLVRIKQDGKHSIRVHANMYPATQIYAWPKAPHADADDSMYNGAWPGSPRECVHQEKSSQTADTSAAILTNSGWAWRAKKLHEIKNEQRVLNHRSSEYKQ